MKRATKGLIIYVLIFIGILMLARLMNIGSSQPAEELTYSSFLQLLEKDDVSHIAITENNIIGLYRDTLIPQNQFPAQYDFACVPPPSYTALIDDINAIYASMLDKPIEEVSRADYKFAQINVLPQQLPIWVDWIPFIIVILLFGVLWIFLMRSQQGSNSKVMTFGKSRARLMDSTKNPITFADVAGADEEKEELQEIVEFLKNPKKFLDLGARIPKGVLLIGMPGTGKTLLAKAVAGEAGVPFFSISGSDFVEMFVGVGASRVRDLFDQAKKQSPAIVFIDEIDAVGRQRGAGLGGGHDEREQTLNQLLVEMDGFSPNEGVIVLAATNRADILDPALLRPGRFDRQVTVHYPDIKGREAILRVHARNKPLDSDVDLSVIARSTPFFTGADLENIMNEAAILAARANRQRIGMHEMEEAITRVQMGPEKRSRQVTDKDKNLVAYHEAGHAVVAWNMPNCDPVHEVSIIPRGGAGGYTMTLPEQEVHYTSSARLLDTVTMMLGGHVAEELVLGDVSTGSTSDLKRATETVHKMITQYGMSKKLGPVYLGGDQEVFIGRDFTSNRNHSEEVAAAIDAETRNIVGECYEKAQNVLREYRAQLDGVARRLIEKEKIERTEFEEIMRGDAEPMPV